MGVEKIRRPILCETVHLDRAFTDGVIPGRLQWNEEDGTLEYGLPRGHVTLQIGQENVFLVWNKSGADIADGAVVYADGVHRFKPTANLALAAPGPAASIMGVATEPIAKNTVGYVTSFGVVRHIDTKHLTGPVAWISPTVPGGLTSTRPEAPNIPIFVGAVLRRHATKGMIHVYPVTYPSVPQLAGVYGTPADGDTIRWVASNNRFEFAP